MNSFRVELRVSCQADVDCFCEFLSSRLVMFSVDGVGFEPEGWAEFTLFVPVVNRDGFLRVLLEVFDMFERFEPRFVPSV